jgi:hypothetical protein
VDEPLENLYFNWLCGKVHRVEVPTPSLTYWNLFRILHDTEFVWLRSGDDNRVEDGLELRDEFLLESRLPDDPSWRLAGCSLFEMLIAFARKAEFNAGETPHFWFWRFLENLGLDGQNDADIDEHYVDNVLFTLVWRGYDADGRGGLFPLNNPKENQRDVEIWYQFCAYLVDIDWPI